MINQSAWGKGAHDAVRKTMWSEDLQFIDRMQCRQVCRTWKSQSQERPSGPRRTDLGRDLCIKFVEPGIEQQHTALWLDQDPPTIVIPAYPSRDSFSACCRWLLRQAPLIRKVQLSGKNDTCYVREVVRTLIFPLKPPMLEITIPLGFGFLEQCKTFPLSTLVVLHLDAMAPELHKVTRTTNLYVQHEESLTLLQGLTSLHTLHLHNIHGYGFCPDVQLPRCAVTTYDLTSCTQVTRLVIVWAKTKDWWWRIERLLLPAGRNVQLHSLSMSADYTHPVSYFELHNLQDATQLTSMQVKAKFPINLSMYGWPLSMPCLNTIKFAVSPNWLPQQLVKYAQLRHLDIQGFASGLRSRQIVPTWFSQLTQLDTLRIWCKAGLSEFPGCLLQLRQLSSIDMRCVHSGDDCIELPVEILHFSEFSALTSIHLRWSRKTAGGPSAYSSRTLQQLDKLRSVLLPTILYY